VASLVFSFLTFAILYTCFSGREEEFGMLIFGFFLAIASAFFIAITIYSFRRGRMSYAQKHLDKFLYVYGSNESPERLYHQLSIVSPTQYKFISNAKRGRRSGRPFVIRNYLVTYLRGVLFIIYLPSMLWVSHSGIQYEHLITYYNIEIYSRISCGGRRIYPLVSISERLYDDFMKFLFECPVPIQRQIDNPNDPYALPKQVFRRTTEGAMLLEAECDKRFPHYYEQLRAHFPE
jgi:hypothetical protein